MSKADDYHADRGTLTHSALKNMGWWSWDGEFNATPDLMKAWFDGDLHSSDSRSKDFGTAVHMLCEGLAPEDVYCIAPEIRRGTNAWKEWEATIPEDDKRPKFKPSEIEAILAMHKNLLHHPTVMNLMVRPGEHEKVVRAVCPQTSQPIKCKPDFRQPGEFVVDFKTTEDPAPDGFLAQAKKLGYHRQAALYLYVIELATGVRERFFHAVVGSKAPRTAAVYEFPQEALELGHRQNLHVLREVAYRREWNEWTPEWANGIIQTWEVQRG
jgi:hypothetical protein